ncbi:oligosaccharide flippase family protein, partial [Sphingobacterium faecium]|uniref:oligosaccharide flippase family protein n=1 Tax=Sphingobacterium faecium TaxID=34087 RepID=UPI00129279D9
LALIQRTKLTINLDFKSQAKISLISILIAGSLSVFMAYKGFGVWALIAQSIAVNLVSLILYFINNPEYPSIKDISKSSFQKLIKFGGHLTLSSLFQAVYQNSFTFIIGKSFSTSALGMYNKSNQFTLMPISVLTNIVNRVTYPEFSKFQEDNNKLASSNLKFAEYFSYLVFPLFIFFASISYAFIKLFLGDLWLEADSILKILALSYLFYPFTVMNMTIFQIKDRTKTFFQIDLTTKIIGFGILCAMIPHGIYYVCISIGIAQILQFIVSSYFSNKLLGFNVFYYLKTIGINLIYFLAVMLVLQQVNSYIPNFYLQILINFIAFLSSTIILLRFRNRELLSSIFSLIKL